MKTQFFTTSFIFTLLIIFSGCDKCRNDECPENLNFRFKVIDNDGASLVGYSPYYQSFNSDSLQVLGLNENDEWIEMDLRQDKEVVFLSLNYEIKEYLINYSFAKDDTLSFEMTEYSDKCCGQIVTDYTLQINNVLQPAINYNTIYEFEK